MIGKAAHYVTEAEALNYVAGYFICNDVSEREYQLERSGQWVKVKMAPTFGPIGPWLVTPDEIADVQNLNLWLEVNGERIQSSNTSDMIFSIARIVADTSRYVLLEPGDIITTRYAPWCWLRHEAATFLEIGQHDAPWNRRTRHSRTARRELGATAEQRQVNTNARVTGKTRLYAIIGDPIAQVRSPEAFNARFASS